MTSSGVYEIRQTATSESFFGCSSDVKRTWARLRRRLRHGQHINAALQEAWERFGEGTFEFRIIEHITDKAEMRRLTKALIQQHRPNYNHDFMPRFAPRTFAGGTLMPIRKYNISHPSETTPDDTTSRTVAAPVSVLSQETYRIPGFDYEAPLLQGSDGQGYVPVDAWCAMLGFKLKTHLWRLRRMFLWDAARELPISSDLQSTDNSTPHAHSHATPTAWCLPSDHLLNFANAVGSKYIASERRAQLKVAWDHYFADEEAQRNAKYDRIRQYHQMRSLLFVSLRWQQQLSESLTTIAEQLRPHFPHLPEAVPTEFERLSARGDTLIAAAAQSTRSALHSMETDQVVDITITDFYDHLVNSYTEPENPILPDLTEQTANERELDAWWQFLRAWLHRQGFTSPPTKD